VSKTPALAPRKEEQVQPQREAPPAEPPKSASKEITPITIADLQVIEPGELPWDGGPATADP
jgi:hypothetical protein